MALKTTSKVPAVEPDAPLPGPTEQVSGLLEVASEPQSAAALPILGALQEAQSGPPPAGSGWRQQSTGSVSSRNEHSDQTGGSTSGRSGNGARVSRTPKRNKKFSQKLTFSDILVEQSQYSRESDFDKEPSPSGAPATRTGDFGDQMGPRQAACSWLGRLLDPSRAQASKGQPLVPGGGQRESAASRLLHSICCAGRLPVLGLKSAAVRRLSANDPKRRRQGRRRRRCQQREEERDEQRQQQQPEELSSVSDDSEATGQRRGRLWPISGQQQNAQKAPSYTAASASHHPIQPKSERKAAKTLSTLLLVFIVTWLPYNVLVLIKTLSGGEDQVPEKIWNFSYYLCYINSTINPLCYALCNAQFRRTYMRILKCKLSNEHNSSRRLVPIQSSSTWNKDLRLNSDANATGGTSSGCSQYNGASSRRP